MSGPGQFGIRGRRSPRQAVIVDATGIRVSAARGGGSPSDRWTDHLRRALLLDLLGSLVGVNGATISVIGEDLAQARGLAGLIPPGLDLIVPPAGLDGQPGPLLWALTSHLLREFSGVVAVAADVVALPTRTVATALSTLSDAGGVVGPAGSHGLYLIGVRDEIGIEIALAAGAGAGFLSATVPTIQAAAREHDAVVRVVDRKIRVGRDDDPARVIEDLGEIANRGPRTEAFLRQPSGADVAATFVPPANDNAPPFGRDAGR